MHVATSIKWRSYRPLLAFVGCVRLVISWEGSSGTTRWRGKIKAAESGTGLTTNPTSRLGVWYTYHLATGPDEGVLPLRAPKKSLPEIKEISLKGLKGFLF